MSKLEPAGKSRARRAGKSLISHTASALVSIGVEKLISLLGGIVLLAALPSIISILRGLPLDLYVTAAIFIGGLALIVLSIVLTWRKTRSTPDTPHSRTEAELPPAIAVIPKRDLTFEIDEDQSQVRVGDEGGEIRRIYADIKLRCFKKPTHVMAVQGFHMSLHRAWPLGDEATLVPKEDGAFAWEDPGMKALRPKAVWTVEGPSTDYRTYHFVLDITPKIHASLSPDHFLRVTMDAVGEEPLAQAVYVDDWHVPNGGFSAISLKPRAEFPHEAQKQINNLKLKLASAEKTIGDLGRHHEKFNWLTRAATEQAACINEWIVVTKCERGDLNLDVPVTSTPNVILAIWVTNKSVLDISLSDDLNGLITFQDTELTDHKKVINAVKDLPGGETRCLTIKQRLSPSEVKAIRDAQALSLRPHFFNFEKLKVTIVGGGRSPDITPKPLNIGKAFATAFPVDSEKRLQRIRALSEVRGSCYQLNEHFRQGSHEPLPEGALERWIHFSTDALERAYKKDEIKLLWHDITNGESIPPLDSGIAQEIWLETCIVNLGEIIVSDAGEYSSYLYP